jgi:hypothetical protein
MNDDFADLETELRAFQPLRPSAALEERLAQAFAITSTAAASSPALSWRQKPWWLKLGFQRPSAAFGWGLGAPAAAACAVLLLRADGGVVSHPAASTAARPGAPLTASDNSPAGGFEPAATSNIVYQTNDEGVVYDAEQEPARQVRYRSEETLAWRNPHTGTQVEVSYPREEVVLTPISLR